MSSFSPRGLSFGLARALTRRDSLSALVSSVVGLGCGSSPGADGAGSGGAGTGGGASSGGHSTTGGSGTGASAAEGGSGGNSSEWASGGTAGLPPSIPDPFDGDVSSCLLAVAAIEGPCSEAADRVRRDVSEGYPGLPVRLAIQVVDAECVPIAGVKVKIWHTQITGSYSGDTPSNDFCLLDPALAAEHFFRGVQTTDQKGRVDFDSCFPGWYAGRAIHVHFTVSLGESEFTSQLVFEEELVREIFTDHPDYAPYGLPDTTNDADLLAADGIENFVLETTRLEGGALLAFKRLVVPL